MVAAELAIEQGGLEIAHQLKVDSWRREADASERNAKRAQGRRAETALPAAGTVAKVKGRHEPRALADHHAIPVAAQHR